MKKTTKIKQNKKQYHINVWTYKKILGAVFLISSVNSLNAIPLKCV